MPNQSPRVETHQLSADDTFPNNPDLPLLIYRQAFGQTGQAAADEVQRLVDSNRWGGTWQNGIFPYHHYHSNAHEVLACCQGTARVQFGGPSGPVVEVAAGDVAVLPAGTAHKRVEASSDFLIVGGYPEGFEDYDLIRDDPSAKQAAAERIANLPLPERDPIYGADGPLQQHWGR